MNDNAFALDRSGLYLPAALATAPLEEECRVCGCTENNPCAGGCAWWQPGLCSACAGEDDECFL